MITEIRLDNVRIYDDRVWAFPLNGLTIFCGTNSAGKSTILKSLLLLAENVLTRGSVAGQSSTAYLKFTNPYIDLGNFKSFVSHNDTERVLHLGISNRSIMSPENYRRLDASVKLERSDQHGRDVPNYIQYTLDADFYFSMGKSLVKIGPEDAKPLFDPKSDEDEGTTEHRALLNLAKLRILSGDSVHAGTTEPPLIEATVIRRLTETGKSSDYYLRFPKRLLASEIEGVPYDFEEDPDPDFGLLRVTMSGLLPERVHRTYRSAPEASDTVSQRYLPLPSFLDESFDDLNQSLSRIVYLGPLRAAARRFYPIHSAPADLYDATGEQVPILLRERGTSEVTCASPIKHILSKCSLTEALDTWLHYFRTGLTERSSIHKREIRINSMEDAFVELGIRTMSGTETHALADSGFGYSQLLPILVRGLMLPPGGILIVEQPELHLNPSLQVRLSDFLVALLSLSKQILIETHSEHIVNAIRAISAESEIPTPSHRCTVYYLDSKDGEPLLHKLNIKEDGSIPDWPQGFFGEAASLLGRIMRARKGKMN